MATFKIKRNDDTPPQGGNAQTTLSKIDALWQSVIFKVGDDCRQDVLALQLINFGFILDIAPGGIEFEASPFKLTTEMIALLGGDASSPEYKLFSELVVRAYLAIRPFAEQMVDMVKLMLDSGLPCFKGEQTITKLRDKFQLGKTERQAAEFMMSQIDKAHENQFRFQNLQNGIPF
ncbi:phosphatidylinositol-4- kinase [Phlyctochytrium bullatum]|nr:phosphatidylinositol-4- kinase [Phlyctochytrium bullatum]